MTNRNKIGIAGLGMVGGAVQRYFKTQGVEPFGYDPGKNIGSIEDINKADVVFICVPTPYKEEKNGFDLSYVKNAVENLKESKTIVVKSTVLPGTTESLQKEYNQHKFLFNPEFLSESTAYDDFLYPDRQLVGFTEESKDVASSVLDILPKSSHEKIMPATEAELVKYFNNTFNSVKVIFANHMYDLCAALNIDYDNIIDSAAASKFIKTKSHLDIYHAGYRGYGGKCLPKDTRALIQFAESMGVDMQLLKTTEELNNKLMRKQRIDSSDNYSQRNNSF